MNNSETFRKVFINGDEKNLPKPGFHSAHLVNRPEWEYLSYQLGAADYSKKQWLEKGEWYLVEQSEAQGKEERVKCKDCRGLFLIEETYLHWNTGARRCKQCHDKYELQQSKPLQANEERKEIKLGMEVYHKDIYLGKEQMKVVGIRENQIELEGDYSGGVHNVCQRDWQSREGILFERSEEPYPSIIHPQQAKQPERTETADLPESFRTLFRCLQDSCYEINFYGNDGNDNQEKIDGKELLIKWITDALHDGMEEYKRSGLPIITDEEMMVYFNNHSNCYADTGNTSVIPAMTRSEAVDLCKWAINKLKA